MNACVLAASAILEGGPFPYVFFSAPHPRLVHPRFASVPTEDIRLLRGGVVTGARNPPPRALLKEQQAHLTTEASLLTTFSDWSKSAGGLLPHNGASAT